MINYLRLVLFLLTIININTYTMAMDQRPDRQRRNQTHRERPSTDASQPTILHTQKKPEAQLILEAILTKIEDLKHENDLHTKSLLDWDKHESWNSINAHLHPYRNQYATISDFPHQSLEDYQHMKKTDPYNTNTSYLKKLPNGDITRIFVTDPKLS